MSQPLQYFCEAAAIGLAVGLLSGGLGVGGGILGTPLMHMLLEIEPHTAVGTSLAMIVPTAIAGALSYMRKGMVAVGLARASAVPAVAGTILGSLSTLVVHGALLMLMIAALLVLTGLDILFGFGSRLDPQEPQAPAEPGEPPVYSAAEAGLMGVACGYLSGFLGVGGGFLLVPLMLYLFKTPIKTAFGTSLAVVAVVSVPGTMVHALVGHVDLTLALSLVVGSVPGAWLGSSLAMRLKEKWLRRAFAWMLIIVAALFAFREIQELVS